MIYDIELRKQQISLSDNDLIKIIEKRFEYITMLYRIENFKIKVYRRAAGEIMHGWHDSLNQSDDLYEKIKTVYDVIDAIKKECNHEL